MRQGEPSVDLGGPVPGSETATYVAQLRKLAETAKPRPKTATRDAAEVRDVALRERLAALQEAPSAAAHRQVALEYRRLGIPDAAFSHLSAAIRLDPKDGASYDLAGDDCGARGGCLNSVFRTPGRPWRSHPGPPVRGTRSACCSKRAAAPDRGVAAYLRAVALDDQASYAWSNLCHAWTLRNDPAAAVQACRRALDLDSTLHWAQVNLFNAERLLAPAARARGERGDRRPVSVRADRVSSRSMEADAHA